MLRNPRTHITFSLRQESSYVPLNYALIYLISVANNCYSHLTQGMESHVLVVSHTSTESNAVSTVEAMVEEEHHTLARKKGDNKKRGRLEGKKPLESKMPRTLPKGPMPMPGVPLDYKLEKEANNFDIDPKNSRLKVCEIKERGKFMSI